MTLTPLRDDRLLAPLREHLAELGPLAEAAVTEWLLGLQEPPGWARRVVLGPWLRMTVVGTSWGRLPLAADEQDKQTPANVYVWSAQGEWWRYDRVVGASVSYPTRALAMRAADGAAHGSYVFDPALPPEEEAAPAPAPEPAGSMPCGPCEGSGWMQYDGEPIQCPECNGTGRERFLDGIVRRMREQNPEAEDYDEGSIDVGAAIDRIMGRQPEPVQWVAPRRAPLVSTSTRHSWNAVRSGNRFLMRCERCGMWRESRRRRHWPANYTFDEAYEVLSWGNGETRAGRCPGRTP